MSCEAAVPGGIAGVVVRRDLVADGGAIAARRGGWAVRWFEGEVQ